MNKRLLLMFIGFALIALILVLNGTVFTVDEITVAFDSAQDAETESRLSAAIAEASGIKTGKNVFTVSESKAVTNITTAVSGVRVLGIERKFPNKVIIHVSRRVPVMAIPFRDSGTAKIKYAVVDTEMVVLYIADSVQSGVSKVENFRLSGNYEITVGKTLTVKFGDEIFYLQNIAAAFQQGGLSPEEFVSFISTVRFAESGAPRFDLLTNSGVTIVIDNADKLATDGIIGRVKDAYSWYKSFGETDREITGGFASYDEKQTKFVWYGTYPD